LVPVLPRSVLFVPGHRLDLAGKAARGAADAVCLDLEDGVAEADKMAARRCLGDAGATLRAAGKPVWVRIDARADRISHDLDALPPYCSTVVVPKVESLGSLHRLDEALHRTATVHGHDAPRLLALVESVTGLDQLVVDTVPPPRSLLALALGTEDLAMQLGCPPGSSPVRHAFDRLALAAARHGTALFGFPGSIAEFRDLDRFEASVRAGCDAGSLGAFCIHPAQLDVLHRCHTVDARTLRDAREIVAAFDAMPDGAAGGGR